MANGCECNGMNPGTQGAWMCLHFGMYNVRVHRITAQRNVDTLPMLPMVPMLCSTMVYYRNSRITVLCIVSVGLKLLAAAFANYWVFVLLFFLVTSLPWCYPLTTNHLYE